MAADKGKDPRPGYKQTEIGEIPKSWELRTLASLVYVGRKITYGVLKPGPYTPDGSPLIRCKDFSGPWATLDQFFRISHELYKEYIRASVKAGDLVMGVKGLVGRVAQVPTWLDGAAITRNAARISVDHKLAFANFVLFALDGSPGRREVLMRTTKTAQPGLNIGDVEAFLIPAPPLPEQRAIAEVLQSVDDALQATQRVIDQQRVVKKGLLQQLLTRGIGHTRFKQTEIGEIPESWEVWRLTDLALPGSGLQTGPFGSQLHASDYTESGVPVVMPKDIVRGILSTSTIAKIPESLADSPSLQKHRMLAGDIVFGRRGDIGRCGLIGSSHDGWLCGTGCLRMRPNTEVHPEFLTQMLQASKAVAWLNENAVGQTMLNINTAILGDLPLPLPPLLEQRAIAEVLQSVNDLIRAEEKEFEGLEVVKGGLMQDLLTGKVRVKAA